MPGSPFPTSIEPSLRLPTALLLGVREWFVLALVVVVLFGRSVATAPGRPLPRWLGRSGRSPRRSSGPLRLVADRWASVLALLTVMGLIAWVAMTWLVTRPA